VASATLCKSYAAPSVSMPVSMPVPMGFTFYLGVHHPGWLTQTTVPLFVSEKRLETRKTLPRAAGMWALDSGGFSQLMMHAGWPDDSEARYVAHVQRYRNEIGNLEWAAPQDWMCEPFMVAKTGLSIAEHQRRTVENYLTLRELDETLPFIPVLQGYTRDDYLRCIDRYAAYGVPLTDRPRLGVGTVCRRQGMREAEEIVRSIHRALPSARLHVFGVKITGLVRFADAVASADSMAWSYHARRNPPLPGHRHKSCANCLEFALNWYQHVRRMSAVVQPPLLEIVA